MIYFLGLLLIYNLFLTLFVVKINNRMEKLEQRGNNTFPIVSNTPVQGTASLASPPMDLFADDHFQLPEMEVPKDDSPLPENLETISKKFDEVLNKSSKEEIEGWINEIKPSSELKTLNKNYKSY